MAGDKQFEVPDSMRDFAEKSVDQAKKAWDDFMTASHSTAGKAEDSAKVVQEGATDIGRRTLAFADDSVSSALEFAQKIVNAKDLNEAMALQQDYMRSQMEALGAHTRGVSETAMKVAEDAAQKSKND